MDLTVTGKSSIHCSHGKWSHRLPTCLPTTPADGLSPFIGMSVIPETLFDHLSIRLSAPMLVTEGRKAQREGLGYDWVNFLEAPPNRLSPHQKSQLSNVTMYNFIVELVKLYV